jgi:hypothetical protein
MVTMLFFAGLEKFRCMAEFNEQFGVLCGGYLNVLIR